MGSELGGRVAFSRCEKASTRLLPLGGKRGMLRAVGKHDSRNSMKMKRRKAQVKKKARLKRRVKERKVAVGAAKKAAPKKTKAAAAPAAPATE
jgi:hypothetical protein